MLSLMVIMIYQYISNQSLKMAHMIKKMIRKKKITMMKLYEIMLLIHKLMFVIPKKRQYREIFQFHQHRFLQLSYRKILLLKTILKIIPLLKKIPQRLRIQLKVMSSQIFQAIPSAIKQIILILNRKPLIIKQILLLIVTNQNFTILNPLTR